MSNKLACPNCHAAITLPLDGNVLDTPLVCQVCGQAFSPHFYCPDVHSPSRHIFTATTLYIDNTGAVYAFCPEHTFTTYAIVTDSKAGSPQPTPIQSLVRFFTSLTFRIALITEGLRRRAFSRYASRTSGAPIRQNGAQ